MSDLSDDGYWHAAAAGVFHHTQDKTRPKKSWLF